MRHDTAFARRMNAGRNAAKRLRDARVALRRKNGKEFYGAVSDALCHFIADNLQVTAPQVTTASLEPLLGAHAAPELRAQVSQFLEMCDFGRFASSAFEAQVAKDQLAACEQLIKRLSHQLR
jgi:hypothetical protein